MRRHMVRAIALALILTMLLPFAAAAGTIKTPYIGIAYEDGTKTMGNRARVGYTPIYLIFALDDKSWSWGEKKTADGMVEGFFASDGLGGFYYIGETSVPKWSLSSGTKAKLSVTADGIAVITRTDNTEGPLGTLQVEMKLVRYELQGSRLVKSKMEMSVLTSVNLVGDNDQEPMTPPASTAPQVQKPTEPEKEEPKKEPASGGKLKNPLGSADGVQSPFADVKETDWFYASFMKLYTAGILHGVDLSAGKDGSEFVYMKKTGKSAAMSLVTQENWEKADKAPTMTEGIHANGATVSTRAATVTMLYNVCKLWKKASASGNSSFTDVAKAAPYADAIAWAAAERIVNGYGEGAFGPNDPITREQMCAILVRLAGYLNVSLPAVNGAKTFTDAGRIQSYAKDAVSVCQRAGIINGYPDGSFGPANPITGNEAYKMIVGFIEAVS